MTIKPRKPWRVILTQNGLAARLSARLDEAR